MKCRECNRISYKDKMVMICVLIRGKLSGELHCPVCGGRMIWNIEVRKDDKM